ncbi:MAG TPA: GMP synthase (glutamine-hydrolyzing) [Flavobacteriales bacterium]|jgi:GMP synthase (glutamine-hydrolysing)|nr:GMP synthase (glutamine-hydrolyzing) [Flavobacteriales bacterium]
MQEKIIILDFGSQYTQLIARRVREHNVYCEIHPFSVSDEVLQGADGLILSGSPFSVKDENAPLRKISFESLDIPVLGICFGAQMISLERGGDVEKSDSREYGRANLSYIDNLDPLVSGLQYQSQVWMSHADTITKLPRGAEVICSTSDVGNAGFRMDKIKFHGVQFHPEVYHTTEGKKILKNFIYDICGCKGDWTSESFIDSTIHELRERIGKDKVVLGLSGGVDSTVAATLLHKAIGKQLYCIFVNNGLLRKDEFPEVLKQYEGMGLNVKGVDASRAFLDALNGVSDPEKKRKIIGNKFIEVFDNEANKISDVAYLGQGTIYPDVIESVSVNGPSVTIKSHHNVGGLPEKMNLKVVEPLRSLFKDEVRRVGRALKISEEILGRHPFPGPGLAIRILGEISKERVRLIQEADAIYINILKETGWYDKIWQAGSILLPVQSVGVMGDERTYEQVVALRAVTSTDGMTADWVHIPYEILARISSTIINKVKGINRVVYDISSKPPSTIEWE